MQLLHLLLATLVAAFMAHPYELAFCIAHAVVGLTPSSWQRATWFGRGLWLLDQITLVTHRDLPGTFEVPPLLRVVWRPLGRAIDGVRAALNRNGGAS